MVRALSARHTVDLLAVREGDQAYVERQGTGRLLRVPTPEGDPRTQVQAFQRALRRQLEGADYDVVHCRDGWCARPVLEGKARFGYAVVYDLTRAPMAERDAWAPELAAAHERRRAGEDLTFLGLAGPVAVDVGLAAGDRVLPGDLYRVALGDDWLHLFATAMPVAACKAAAGDGVRTSPCPGDGAPSAREPSLSGGVTVSWSITPGGDVAGARVQGSTLGNARVEGCVLRQIARLRFPAADKGTNAAYPFIFKPGKK